MVLSSAPDLALRRAVAVVAPGVNLGFRHHSGSLTGAAFLSAPNDVLANAAIIAPGLLTLGWPTGWPALIVGLDLMLIDGDAARAEHRGASA